MKKKRFKGKLQKEYKKKLRKQSRKVKDIKIPINLFVGILSAQQNYHFGYEDLPSDTVMVNTRTEKLKDNIQNIYIRISSNEFEEVKPGQKIPVIEPRYFPIEDLSKVNEGEH